MEKGIPDQDKITVELVGQDGNIFVLVGIVSGEMNRAGQREKAKEMSDRIFSEAGSYDEALVMIMEYVNVE